MGHARCRVTPRQEAPVRVPITGTGAGASARDWSGNPVTYVQVRKGNVDCGRCLRGGA